MITSSGGELLLEPCGQQKNPPDYSPLFEWWSMTDRRELGVAVLTGTSKSECEEVLNALPKPLALWPKRILSRRSKILLFRICIIIVIHTAVTWKVRNDWQMTAEAQQRAVPWAQIRPLYSDHRASCCFPTKHLLSAIYLVWRAPVPASCSRWETSSELAPSVQVYQEPPQVFTAACVPLQNNWAPLPRRMERDLLTLTSRGICGFTSKASEQQLPA